MIPRENGFLPEILRAHGYATYAVGKWHLTPEDEVNMAGSRASWPLGRGFDRWYGFHGGETHQFAPVALPRQPRGARARHLRGRLPPERRPRRPRDRVRLRPARGRRRAAVLLLPRHRRVPLAASRPSGVDRALPRSVRRRVGRVAGSDVRAPARERPASRRYRAFAATALGTGVGRPRTRGPEGRGPLHGVLCRVPLVHRRADRTSARLPRGVRRPRQHA